MAENLVSKFTVNSQGTDINIKIKDEDARNLIAQEISDRSKLISKDTDGNTNVTSSTGDVNVSGKNITNAATTITDTASGDMTLNVDGNLSFNTKNPIKYSQPVSKLNDFFNIVPYTDNNGNRYNVLCDNGNTVNLSSNNNFKNYILVGDSYAVGYTPEGNVTGWTTLLNSLLGEHLYAKIEQSGAGLSNKITGEYNLTTRISSLTNSDSVDSIICCCGRNDIDGDNVTGITQGIKNFVDICHLKFKNAKVYIGFIGWDLNKTEWTATKSYVLNLAIAAYKNVNADYVYINTDFILRQRSYMASDGKHPNQDGQNALAYGIKCALYGGIPSYTKPFTQHTYPELHGDGTYQINENFVGGTTFLQFTVNTSLYYHGTNENVTFNNYELTVLKNVELDYIVPSGYNLTTMQARIMLQTKDGTFYTLDVPAYFKSNSDGTYDLVINISLINHAGTDWARGIINYFHIYGSICVANPLT